MKAWIENRPRLKYLLIIAATSLGVYLGFKYILPLILPFLFAYFLAWIIRPSTEFLYRKLRFPRILGGTLSLGVLLAILGTGLFYLLDTLLKQAIALIRNIPVYADNLAGRLDFLCSSCDKAFGLTDGTLRGFVDGNLTRMVDKMRTNVMPGITQRTIAIITGIITASGILLIIIISTILIVKELPAFHKKYGDSDLYHDIHKVTDKLADAGIAYLRTQLIIMTITAIVSVLGLMIMKNEYALLVGIIIAFMDALPILGSGIIYIPWSIVMLFNGNIYAAAILMTTFLVCLVLREVLEPKLIGNRIGIKPLFTIIAMYIGVNLFSIAGFILGPIGLIVIVTIVKVIMGKAGTDGGGNTMEKEQVTEESSEEEAKNIPLDKDNILE